jgi:uncharacterized protein (DUF2252 family)
MPAPHRVVAGMTGDTMGKKAGVKKAEAGRTSARTARAPSRAEAAAAKRPVPNLMPVADRVAAGKALREWVPRPAHAEWAPAPDRPDPISLLEEQCADRLLGLVPIRYGRMMTSPFAFLRGSAIVMAEDLAGTPRTGIDVQACGDAHLANFGVFATPERNIVFDINDFDETLPGPWEWDLKRLAASFVVSGRHRGFDAATSRTAVLAMLWIYGLRMRELAAMRTLDVWYSRLDAEQLLNALKGSQRRAGQKGLAKARLRDHLQAQAKLTEVVDGHRRIIDAPPLIQRGNLVGRDDFVRKTFQDYLRTLPLDRRTLLSRYRFVDAAQKVVGVGSVGTWCFIVLMEGRADDDPLFLQVKEATSSVLERHLKKSRYSNHAERVVHGQRLTQAASDIFLGWIRGRGAEHRDFYWRQLRDVKGSADLETIQPAGLILYGEACGAALARAHARSGDAAMITGYIGTGNVFANAIADFAERYADQTEKDHAALVAAVKSGRVEAAEGV